jgi:malic enzyme
MAIAAAEALAAFAVERGMDEESILPRMDEWEAQVRVAEGAR